MNEPELLQLIDRVENDLANNWAVDKDDIRQLVEMTKQVGELNSLMPPFEILQPVNMFVTRLGTFTVDLVNFEPMPRTENWSQFIPNYYCENWKTLSLSVKRSIVATAIQCHIKMYEKLNDELGVDYAL